MVEKIFRSSKILCSDTKEHGYTYQPRKEAIGCNFIQFNTHAITTLSVDIDYCSKDELNNRLSVVPTPSMVVETTKGFHIHYMLEYPISHRNISLVRWATHIREQLSILVGGDVHANGLKRVYRNPLKHANTCSDVTYTLKDFGIAYPKRNFVTGTRKRAKFVDFNNVQRGGRHMSMFDYIRSHAYKHSGRDDLIEVLTFISEEANSKLDEPLSNAELSGIVSSVCKFMNNTYIGSSATKSEYNKYLAKAKHDKSIKQVIDSLLSISFKGISKMSARAISRVCNVSNSTVSLHIKKIIEILKDKVLNNIAISKEAYMELMNIIFEYTQGIKKEHIGGFNGLRVQV